MQKETPLALNSPEDQYLKRLTFWYAYFMAFPAIVIVQNISIFIFPFLFILLYRLSGRLFSLRYGIQFIAIAFGVGAIISVVNIPINLPANSLSRALTVLPNYLYWVILILMFTTHSRWIRLDVVYKAVLWGVLSAILYFFVLQHTPMIALPIFKVLTQNNFAFLLICFSPIVVWYTSYHLGFWSALLIIILLTLCGFLSGSRSGSLLTLSGGVFTLLLNRKSGRSIYVFILLGYFATTLMIETAFVKNIVFDLNERTYDIIYNRKKTLEEDRSFLVRLAQIEKAMIIYEKYPLSGIGLNNFGNFRVKLPGNFEGAEYVIDKKKIDQVSAHNSYFGFLAEGGLVLIIPFVFLLLYCIVWFFRNLSKLSPEYKPIFISVIHMSIHLYFIYAILNVFAWFVIALACMVIVKHKQ